MHPTKINPQHSFFLTLTLSSLYAISIFAIDTFIPAVSAIAQSLSTSPALISQSFANFILELAIGSFIGGLISDRYKRKNVLLLSLIIFTIFSLALYFVSTLSQFNALRLVQSLSSGVFLALINPIIYDSFPKEKASRIVSIVQTLILIVAGLAPLIGGLLLHFQTWRIIPLFITFSAIITFIAVTFFVPSSNNVHKIQHTLFLKNYIFFLSDPSFSISRLLSTTLRITPIFIYITVAPTIYIETYHLCADHISLVFATSVTASIITVFFNSLLLEKYSADTLILKQITIINTLLLVLPLIFIFENFHLSFLSFFLWITAFFTLSAPLITNSIIIYFSSFPTDFPYLGTASAVLSITELILGGIASRLTLLLTDNTESIVLLFCILTPLQIANNIYLSKYHVLK